VAQSGQNEMKKVYARQADYRRCGQWTASDDSESCNHAVNSLRFPVGRQFSTVCTHWKNHIGNHKQSNQSNLLRGGFLTISSPRQTLPSPSFNRLHSARFSSATRACETAVPGESQRRVGVQMQSDHTLRRWLTVLVSIVVALGWAPSALAAPPALVNLSPASAFVGGQSFTLTVAGENFDTSSTTRWGAIPLLTTYKSATELTAVVPASLIALPGAVSVTVTTSGGVSSGVIFAVNPLPAFSIQNPSSAVHAPGVASLNANDANPVSDSAWSTATLPTTIGSATQRSLASSAINVTPSCLVPPQKPLDASQPPPTITSLSPNSVFAGSQTFTLTVNGSNFLPGSLATVVRWNYTALTTTYVSSTQVTAAVPASLIPFGSANITVVTAGGTSTAYPFTVNPAMPIIISISMSRCIAGYGAFITNVFGTNFTSTATVNWGSTPLSTTPLDGSMLSIQVPANLVATAGTVNITVTTAGGTSAPVTFTVLPPPPVITGLSQTSVAAGSAAFTLTVYGLNFSTGMNARWGTTWVGAYNITSTQFTTTIPASLIATAGVTSIIVYTVGGGGSNSVSFTMNPSPPAITSLSPSSATADSAGFMLTIIGTAFTPDATTTWGTTPLDTIYVSPTQLTTAVPASLIENSGTASVTVSMAAGTSFPATFTIKPSPPTITGLSSYWVTAGGPAYTLIISGENFTTASIAKWGSTALATTYINQAQLTAAIPAGLITSAGSVSLAVTTSAGASTPVTITINPALKITTTSLPAGTAGNAYSGPISVTGGSPGYTWTATGLPANFSIPNTSGSTLTITGTPASPGAITFQVSVQDTAGASAGPVAFTINVASGPTGANNAGLNGNYVCLFQGSVDTDRTRWATTASFQADGQGNFTSGVFDTNSYDIGSASGTISGSYSVASDNNGMASIHTVLTDGAAGIQTTQWTIALSSATQPAQQFRMIEADDLGTLPSYQQGSANCYLATPSAFTGSTINGSSFVFALDGEDNNGNMKSTAGLLSASGENIMSGNIDVAHGGSATVQTSTFNATYTAPDPATGRFTISLEGAGSSTGLTVYIIDANRMFVLDNTSNDGEQAGNMRKQQQASWTASNLSGPFVLYTRGAEFNSSGSEPSGFYTHLFQGAGDGAGSMTINQSYANDAGVYSAGQSNGSPIAINFDPAHPGRAIFPLAGGTTYLYLFNNNIAFTMSVEENGSLDSGMMEPQTQTSFTNSALAGNYLFSNLAQLNIEPSSTVGILNVTASSTINANFTTASRGNLVWDQSSGTTYIWDASAPASGTFLITNGTQSGAACAVISVSKFVCTSQNDPTPTIQLAEQ
jgi:hypothetical protein